MSKRGYCVPAGAALLLLSGCGGGGGVNSTGTPPSSTTTTTPPADTGTTPTTGTGTTTTTPTTGTGSTTTTPTTGTTTTPTTGSTDTNPTSGTTTTTPTTGTGSTTTTTTTTPATTSSTINYNDAEYTRSNSATGASAISAWSAGSTGAGVTIAILDSGLTDAKGEFTGRISSASTSISDTAGYADQDGHGTAVAAVAAAARNGSDIEGIAFGATVMALRTDSTGTCGTTDGCAFSTATLTTALDYAVTHGAKVVNMSLGGSPATSQLKAAINRATAAGIIIVIAGGNDGDAEPDPFAQVASDPVSRGLVIIAGAVDSTGTISSFSDKAGDYANYYLTSLGTRVRSFDNSGTDYYYSGTSFSAPAIAAAVALLEQAFPNLTPAQVVSLLYASATDAGTSGVDSTYGRGILNLVKAFQPLGTSSLAGSTQAISLTQNAVLSSAMGDATLSGSGLDKAVILDGYGRAFSVNLTGTVAHIGQRRPLSIALAGNLATQDQQNGRLTMSFTMARDTGGDPSVGFGQRGLTANGQHLQRPVSGSATLALGDATSASFGFGTSGRQMGDMIVGTQGTGGSFLVARSSEGPGFDNQGAMAMALSHRWAGFTFDATAERGTLPTLLGDHVTPTYTMLTMRATRGLGPLSLGLGLGLMDEAQTVLGARFNALLGGRGAVTRTADLDARLALGRGWSLHGSWRQGWTRALAGGALANGELKSAMSAFDLGHVGRRTRFGLRYAEPLRVTGGGFALSVPTGYDYSTLQASYTLTRLDLTPAGHERDAEASYGIRVVGGWLDANLYLRKQPGNIADAPDDVGAALRYAMGF